MPTGSSATRVPANSAAAHRAAERRGKFETIQPSHSLSPPAGLRIAPRGDASSLERHRGARHAACCTRASEFHGRTGSSPSRGGVPTRAQGLKRSERCLVIRSVGPRGVLPPWPRRRDLGPRARQVTFTAARIATAGFTRGPQTSRARCRSRGSVPRTRPPWRRSRAPSAPDARTSSTASGTSITASCATPPGGTRAAVLRSRWRAVPGASRFPTIRCRPRVAAVISTPARGVGPGGGMVDRARLRPSPTSPSARRARSVDGVARCSSAAPLPPCSWARCCCPSRGR